MRREEATARARLLPSTAALVSSAEVKLLEGYFEISILSCGALAAKREIRTLLKMLL